MGADRVRLARLHRIDDPQSWQVSRDDVIGLLPSEKARGAGAWQRLKFVDALVQYQRIVRKADEPNLEDIRQISQARVVEERQGDPDSPTIEVAAGVIDTREPEVIQELRRALRVQQRALATERLYVHRVREFMRKWCDQRGSTSQSRPTLFGIRSPLTC